MPTLKLGFALEGESDYRVIARLTRRAILEDVPEVVLSEDSILRPRKQGHGFVKELPTFAAQLRDDGADILVAVVDTDNSHKGERLKLLHEAKARCTELGLALCMAEGLAVRALEAWLLADEVAVFQVFDGDRASVTFPSPERDPDPKTTLNQMVRILTSGREITFASYAEELAEAIRLAVLRQKCPHFDDFVRNLIRCVREWQRVNLKR
jgi:hypothetical protein